MYPLRFVKCEAFNYSYERKKQMTEGESANTPINNINFTLLFHFQHTAKLEIFIHYVGPRKLQICC